MLESSLMLLALPLMVPLGRVVAAPTRLKARLLSSARSRVMFSCQPSCLANPFAEPDLETIMAKSCEGSLKNLSLMEQNLNMSNS